MKPPRTLGLQFQRWHHSQTHKPGMGVNRAMPGGVQADWGATLEYNADLTAKTLSNVSFGNTTANSDGDMNISAFKATGTTPGVANVEFSVQHTLTHVPIGFIIISVDHHAHIYKSTPGTAWTSATRSSFGTIYLMCDTPTVVYSIMVI